MKVACLQNQCVCIEKQSVFIGAAIPELKLSQPWIDKTCKLEVIITLPVTLAVLSTPLRQCLYFAKIQCLKTAFVGQSDALYQEEWVAS